MALLPTATRVWKHLSPPDRLTAATAFFGEVPAELAGVALGALAKARHMRPQAARRLPPDAQARILATVLDPGEPLAQGLLVALHLADRRPILTAFLDALALPLLPARISEQSHPSPQPAVTKRSPYAQRMKPCLSVAPKVTQRRLANGFTALTGRA